MRETTVAIIGAGIGGATLALALARKGIDLVVLEQAPAFKPLYKGEYLQPRSLQIFDHLGIAESIREATHPVYYSAMGRDNGEIITDMDMREFGPFEGRNGHHREIQGAVLATLRALPNADLQMGVRLNNLRREGARWVLETSTGPLAARYVVGADGRRSVTRSLLGIQAEEHPYPGDSLAVTVDLDAEAEPRIYQCFGQRDSGYSFPLPRRQARLYLVIDDEQAAQFQARPDGGLGPFKQRLTAYFPRLGGAIAKIDSMKGVQRVPAYALKAERWVVDGAALLGDAAHCVNPARGQGMNLAIADAFELADLLRKALQTGDLSANALAPYEVRRRPYAEYIQRDADRARAIFLSQNPLIGWLRDRTFRNSGRARRASRRMIGTFCGLMAPPTPLEDLLMYSALMAPVLDPLVPGAPQ